MPKFDLPRRAEPMDDLHAVKALTSEGIEALPSETGINIHVPSSILSRKERRTH